MNQSTVQEQDDEAFLNNGASVLLIFFSPLKNCDTMKRKYFNDSSICWRIIGETRYEEEVGMLEKWESVKGTIKTMGKELSAAFDWAFDRLFSRIRADQ